ncbi:MAG: DPP IV N-terminal domain-containing protein, partial [Candidatus Thorarchaeota archaeon]
MKKRTLYLPLIALGLFFLTLPQGQSVMEEKIAFAVLEDNWDIYAMNTDGSHLTQLTDLPGNEIHPAWSPYGTQIAFVSDMNGNNDIYIMKADGSEIKQLTTDSASDERPAWSPDGSQIVFISTRDGSDELYLTDTDVQGSPPTRLTDNQWIDSYPCWSPDGSSLIFVRSVDGNTDIYTLDLATGKEKNLTDDPARDSFPSVSPTGDIAFLSDRENPGFPFYHLYIMKADGSDVVKLTEDHVMWECPTWSPQGTMVAYVGSTDIDGEHTTDIYVRSVDGSYLVNLTQSMSFVDDPTWCCLKDPVATVQSLLREAEQAFDNNEFQKAYDLAVKARSISPSDESVTDLIEMYESVFAASNQLETARVFMEMGENEKALGLLYGVRMIFEQYALSEKVAEIDALLSDIEQQKQVQDTLLSAESLFQKGKQAYETQEYEAALNFFQQARELFASVDSEKAQECEEWI